MSWQRAQQQYRCVEQNWQYSRTQHKVHLLKMSLQNHAACLSCTLYLHRVAGCNGTQCLQEDPGSHAMYDMCGAHPVHFLYLYSCL
jgi:hypothetical protein